MKDLVVKIAGAIQDSNFDEYKEQILAQIKGADKALVTDADFEHAVVVVKACKDGESSIKAAKAQAIASMEDVNKLYLAMDEIAEQLRQTRLSLDKKIKTEKETRKADLLEAEINIVGDYIDSIDFPHFTTLAAELEKDIKSDLVSSMRGRSSLKSIEENLKNVSFESMGLINVLHSRVQRNSKLIEEFSEGFTSLFPDQLRLLVRDHDVVQELVQSRVVTHKAELEQIKHRQEKEAERRKDFEETEARNNKANAEASMGQNVATRPRIAPAPSIDSYSIIVTFSGDATGAKEVERMVINLFDDEPRVTSISTTKNNIAA